MASAYMLKKTGESEHLRLVPQPISAAFVKPSFTLTLPFAPYITYQSAADHASQHRWILELPGVSPS